MEEYSIIKHKLYQRCLELVNEKVQTSQDLLAALKESAGSETKSSAGDKHETGRAMMHLEQEKHARQLSENLKLKQVLDRIEPTITSEKAGLGSLVVTNKGLFFLSVALGKLTIEQVDCYAVSLNSPVAKQFIGCVESQEITFNGQSFRIVSIV